jgi:hypothetical protein
MVSTDVTGVRLLAIFDTDVKIILVVRVLQLLNYPVGSPGSQAVPTV